MKTLIRNGRLVLESGIEACDLLAEGERIAAIGKDLSADDARVIDAAGCYVLPGLIDFHTHVDDQIGRFYLADDYELGTRAAVLNGITTLCTFVTQSPDGTLRQAMRAARGKAEGRCRTDVAWHLTPTTFSEADWHDLEALTGSGYLTLKFYTTYRNAGIYADEQILEAVFRRLGPLGVRFLVHCEDDATIAGVDAGALDLAKGSAHARLRPEEAEIRAVDALLALAARCDVALHVVHVSTNGGAERILAARQRQDVTCETCPQYLWLDEQWLARPNGHRWICSPPLRGGRARFRELALAGAFDMIATDHCPFAKGDKDNWDGKDVRTVANGLAGIGALPHLAWKLWENDPDRAARELVLRLSAIPARRLGCGDRKGALRPGLDADVAVLDPRAGLHPVQSSLAEVHETYPGFESPLAFRHVLLRGLPVVVNGRLNESLPPAGRPLQGPA